MNISDVNSSAYFQGAASAKSAKASSASSSGSALTSASGASDQTSDGGVQTTDFTHMTRAGLADWVNSQIKSGKMSLEDSTVFVSMTVKIPAGGTYTGLDNHQSVNFMQMAQGGITWAQQNNDPAMVEQLQAALGIMQKNQGQTTGVNLMV